MDFIKALLLGILAIFGLFLTWIAGLLAHPVVFSINLFGGVVVLILTGYDTLGWTMVALGLAGLSVLFTILVLTIYAARSQRGRLDRAFRDYENALTNPRRRGR